MNDEQRAPLSSGPDSTTAYRAQLCGDKGTWITVSGEATGVREQGTGVSVELIAKTCHELNRTFCDVAGEGGQLPWEEAPTWQRESAILGVRFHLDNPHADASSSHVNWMKDKLADGWKYGPVKDPAIKEHPCMVAYGELPLYQQWKDHFFKTIVNALGESV